MSKPKKIKYDEDCFDNWNGTPEELEEAKKELEDFVRTSGKHGLNTVYFSFKDDAEGMANIAEILKHLEENGSKVVVMLDDPDDIEDLKRFADKAASN